MSENSQTRLAVILAYQKASLDSASTVFLPTEKCLLASQEISNGIVAGLRDVTSVKARHAPASSSSSDDVCLEHKKEILVSREDS